MKLKSTFGVLLAVGFLGWLPPSARAQATAPDTLAFFNNWFVTGDYAVAGIGFKDATPGQTRSIQMTGIPCTDGARLVSCGTPGATQASPLAAFLYWQTIESGTTSYLDGRKGIFNGYTFNGARLADDATSKCWLGIGNETLRTYRADVLRFMVDKQTMRRTGNGSYTLSFPKAGTASVPSVLGASLVVIYRFAVPGNPALVPLRSVVIYDGAFTLHRGSPDMTQRVAGYYQSSLSAPAAQMTHIVGNAKPGTHEIITVGGLTPSSIVGDQPFYSAQGQNWDSLTFPFALDKGSSYVDTRTSMPNNSSNCISWAAIVTSMNVQDTDSDGLLDVWETRGIHRNTPTRLPYDPLAPPATFGGCTDYPQEGCVNLPAMGANPNRKDIFVQLDWMRSSGDGGGSGAHSHIPKLAALKAVSDAFQSQNIALHFDAGNNYQQAPALPFIIPAGLTDARSEISEADLNCTSGPCTYGNLPYPALSFKYGLNSVKDGNHLFPAAGPLSSFRAPRFAQNRKDAFHYMLFAHSLAGPFVRDTSDPNHPNKLKAETPTPKSFSGIGDRPGADVMITLGLWRSDIAENDQVGSALVQAGTIMHELGHNLNLSHGGGAPGPNCSPNYPSVMSYLYQTRGLIDQNGIAQINFSNGLLSALNESSPPTALGPLAYGVRYYAPLGPKDSPGQMAKRYCDGRPFATGDPGMVRLEAPWGSTPDWSNGVRSGNIDVNLDGLLGLLKDWNDWGSLNLQQVGSRPNLGSMSLGSMATDVGSMATDAGSMATDAGSMATDVGSMATDAGSMATDVGSMATDAGSMATDAGSMATDAGSMATDAGDLDYDTHNLTTTDKVPAQSPQCPTCGLTASSNLNTGINLSWTPPGTGGGLTYNVYRCLGDTCSPFGKPFLLPLRGTLQTGATPSYLDPVNDVRTGASCPDDQNVTCGNTLYTYAVTAVSTVGVESPYSNTATGKAIRTVVTATLSVPDKTYDGTKSAPGAACNLPAGIQDLSCTVNSAEFSSASAGPSPQTVTATVSLGGNAAGGYVLASNPITGSARITQKAASVTPNAATKGYGASDPSFTGTLSGFLPGDNVTATYARTAGETVAGSPYSIRATLSPAGVLANYTITYNTANFTITPATASVTANAATKVYGASDPSFTGTLSGFLPGDNVTATYARTTGETVAGGPYTVSATLSPTGVLANYNITYKTAIFTITPASASVTPAAATKVYGTADPAFTGALTGFLAADNVTATYARTAGETVAASPYAISATLSPAGVLGNYTITYNTANFTITPATASVTPNTATKVYGASDPSFTGTLSGFLPADGVSAAYTRTAGEAVAGGPYTISATLSPAGVLGNYTIAYNTANFTITPATASVTPNAVTKTYGALDPPFTGTLSGFLPADGVTAAYARTAGEAVAGGPYTVSATLSPAGVLGNYAITYNTASFTITRKDASVTPNAAGMTYGATDPALTGILSGFLPGDSVTAAYVRTQGTTVGSYTISATLSPAGALGNYNITYNTANFAINKATASVTPNSATKVYGDLDPAFTGTLSGFLPADNVTAAYGRTPGTAAGPYSISATLSPAGVLTNYTITYNTASFTITPKPLAAAITASDKIYDGSTAAAAACTPIGVVPGDTVLCSAASAAFATATVGAAKTVTATGVVLSGSSFSNYTIPAIATGAASITPRAASVTPDAKTKTYGAPDPVLTGTLTGFVPADNVTAAYARTPGETVGTYTISSTLSPAAALGNYSITYRTALFTIAVPPVLSFTATGSMLNERAFHTATLLGGNANAKVLLAGGKHDDGTILASAEIYDPVAKTFTATANNMPNKAVGHTATLLLNGKVLIAGGGNSNAQLYDPASNKFSSTGGMSGQRSNHTATLLKDGRVLLAGGSGSTGRAVATAQLYDPSTATFSNTGSMTSTREWHTATLLPDGRVLITGGRDGSSYRATADIYDPSTGTFTATAGMAAPRAIHEAALLLNGTVMVCGGFNGADELATAEIYDPIAGTFRSTGSMITARDYFTATVLGSGIVLVTGGYGVDELKSTEIFASPSFFAGANMLLERWGHTATLLNDGSVLITGGKTEIGDNYVRSAELYK